MTLNLALKLAGCVLLLIAVFMPHAGQSRNRRSRSEPLGERDVPASSELPAMNAAK